MMPVLRISDATFLDLTTIAKWHSAPTPSSVIDKLVTAELARLEMESGSNPSEEISNETATYFEKMPGLMHTKVLSSSVEHVEIQKPNWASILKSTIRSVKKKGFEKTALVAQLEIPASVSKLEEQGYTYYPELGISFQGQSAQDSWREIARLSDKHSISTSVRFKWREKDGAQHPGKEGILKAGPQ